jgi:hypothetical protein
MLGHFVPSAGAFFPVELGHFGTRLGHFFQQGRAKTDTLSK